MNSKSRHLISNALEFHMQVLNLLDGQPLRPLHHLVLQAILHQHLMLARVRCEFVGELEEATGAFESNFK